MMKIIDIKQHYVPQFYLKNFGELLYAFDKTNGERFKTTPKNIAMQKNFYGGEIESAPSLEKALSSLESDFVKAVRELIEKENYQLLSNQLKIKIHNFLSLQYVRTPAHRKEIVEVYNHVLNEVAKAKGIEDANVRLTEKSEVGVHLQTIGDYPLFGMLIGRMKFVTMINKTPVPFWTSDNPVCFDNFVPNSMGNLGIISTGVQIHLPITPRLMLTALDPIFFQDFPDVNEIYNKKGILFENFLQVKNSTRWLFSNTKKFHEVKDMLEEYPELKNPEKNRAQFFSGTYKNSDVIGFSRHSSRSEVLPEGNLSTWMSIEEYEKIKTFYDNLSKSRKNSSSQNKNQ